VELAALFRPCLDRCSQGREGGKESGMTFVVKPSRKPAFWALVEGKEAPKKPAPAPKKPKPSRSKGGKPRKTRP